MKTKLFNNIIILSILTIGLFGCQDDFLGENPQDFLSPSNFYTSESDAKAALMAAYNGLRGTYSRNLYFMTDMPSEQTWYGTTSNVDRINIDAFQFEPSNSISTALWNDTYEAINKTNVVIDRVPGIDMATDKRDVIVAEARFIRALFYFNLVRLFGGVPLRLNETTSLVGLDLARSSTTEVYDAIIADLLAAEAILPAQQTGADIGRATKGAASTLLAYVYLTQKDWAKAASKAKEVIDNAGTYGYGLFTNYADLWKIENENTLEHIFMCQYTSGPQGVSSDYSFFFASRQANPIQKQGSGFGQHLVEPAFWSSFDVADTRRDPSILSSFTNPTTGDLIEYPATLSELSIWKYYDPAPFARSNGSNNYPILRFSDLYLIEAEALNEQSGPATAYASINIIRSRAGLPDLSGLTQDEFRAAILQERSWEFAFESRRYFDLIRTEQLVPIMTATGKNPTPKNLLFPIPQIEIDVNHGIDPSDQNPGY